MRVFHFQLFKSGQKTPLIDSQEFFENTVRRGYRSQYTAQIAGETYTAIFEKQGNKDTKTILFEVQWSDLPEDHPAIVGDINTELVNQ